MLYISNIDKNNNNRELPFLHIFSDKNPKIKLNLFIPSRKFTRIDPTLFSLLYPVKDFEYIKVFDNVNLVKYSTTIDLLTVKRMFPFEFEGNKKKRTYNKTNKESEY